MLGRETGVEVLSLVTLRQALCGLFARYGGVAIAVKAAHAYSRTLAYTPRTDAETEPVLQKLLRGQPLSEAESLCLGDWCLARGVEGAIEYRLPFKIHTGFLAYANTMTHPDRLRAGHLCPLLASFPGAKFVLMHTAYPYSNELVAVAKQFTNVYVDMCWGWTIDFHAALDFVRRMLHAVPANKLFAFGGDTFWPSQTVAYAFQARDGLNRALQAEIDDGFLTECEAIQIAQRVMRDNQYAVFDICGRRETIRARLSLKKEQAL
jgi:predicted TIM-barrel fold metal-dependent hydrolase